MKTIFSAAVVVLALFFAGYMAHSAYVAIHHVGDLLNQASAAAQAN